MRSFSRREEGIVRAQLNNRADEASCSGRVVGLIYDVEYLAPHPRGENVPVERMVNQDFRRGFFENWNEFPVKAADLAVLPPDLRWPGGST